MKDNQSMSNINERGFLTCAEEDKISNLPEHLTDSILERLPFEDVVRMSIISKNWRYRWITMRELVFDEQFSKKIAKNGDFDHNGFIRTINQVLILHKGPITKFHLYIPKMVLDSFQEVDQWMLLLSRNGIRELNVTNSNSNQGYELPSYVFRCLELTTLKVWNCFCKQPLMFEGFPKLEYLQLFNINFGANLCGTQINLPQLKVLKMYVCTHVYNFNVKATKLQSLTVFPCPDARLLQLLNSPCIINLYISSHEPIKGLAPVERIDLARMLSKFPRIRDLSINYGFLKYVIKENIPKWLPHAINSLKRLSLQPIQLGELCQLHGVLCLLRNSPNMESLRMILWGMYPGVGVGPASNHLETPNCLDCSLNKLQTVEIIWLEGSRPELLFIKLLLAHSPSLKKFTITPYRSCDAQKRLDIGKDVMQFPRASPKAEIIYLNRTA